ncbi:hypothetical protein [Phytohabitans houttuyneae]|nr:hypothetical protein [Phytohabitans houttuyneae]
MTTPPEPPVSPGSAEPYALSNLMPQPAQPPTKSRVGLFVGIAAAVLLAGGLGAGAALLVSSDKEKPNTAPAAQAPSPSSSCAGYGVDASTGAVVCKPAGAEDVVNQQPAYDEPTKSDFKLSIKVLKKECFGSAGCNIVFRIQVAASASFDKTLDPSKTYEVTYEVLGGEDPLQNTFELTGDQSYVEEEEIISTATSNAKLTAVVLDVSPRGY